MANYIAAIFGLTMSVILTTNVLIPQVIQTDTSQWSAGAVALFSVLTLVAVMGLVYSAGTIFGMI